MNKSPMTVVGAEKLQDELDHLKRVRRPRVIKAIAEARALGDLKENAEYHAAREEQSFIEGRILEVEGKLSNAQIIDISQIDANGKVVFGTTVEIARLDDDTEMTYRIVGEDEADIKAGMISIQAPIARALIGKKEGDVVAVNAPSGETEYEVLAVRYE